VEKTLKILYCPQLKQYLIGYFVREVFGVRQWAILDTRWQNMSATACNSPDDIVDLTQDDEITFLSEMPAWR